jgi:hypothetical protein
MALKQVIVPAARREYNGEQGTKPGAASQSSLSTQEAK